MLVAVTCWALRLASSGVVHMQLRSGVSCNIFTIEMLSFLKATIAGHFATTDLVGAKPGQDARALHLWPGSVYIIYSLRCAL